MELALFKTLWGHDGGLDHAVHLCKETGFQGIEGPVPLDPGERGEFFGTLERSGLEWIAEVSTCTPPGLYVPLPGCSVEQHLRSLEDGVVRSLEGSPRFINTMAGYDAWSFSDALRFFEGVVGLQEKHGIVISVETHRGRPTFSPWLTHWCVVAERLVLDEFKDILALAASRAHHIQPRVGYSQGPQVPDPRAPEHAEDLAAHERWWSGVWDSMANRGFTRFTMTPEFGPDGYLQCEPFTRKPVADLWEINRWIGLKQRERFLHQFPTPPPP
jgi:hypothetical protein